MITKQEVVQMFIVMALIMIGAIITFAGMRLKSRECIIIGSVITLAFVIIYDLFWGKYPIF